MKRENELKSCPFCGGRVMSYPVRLNGKIYEYFVACDDCGAKSGEYLLKKTVIEAWNRRTP